MPARHVLTTRDLPTWRDWYARLESPSPYHDPEYLELLAGNFEQEAEIAQAFVLADGDEFVYYPFIRRPLRTLPFATETSVDVAEYSDIVSSWYYGGPISSPGTSDRLRTAFVEAFKQYSRESGIVAEFIRFDPNAENHLDFDALDPIHNRQTVPIDLTQGQEAIWQGYEGRNQRAINQARETEIVVQPTNEPEDVEAFHTIYTNAMAARDAADHYRFSLEFFRELLARAQLATLFVARYRSEVIGGFIVVHDDRIGHHYLSASNPDYWDLRVNNLLYHEVVMEMQETGREVFDFQGGRPGVFKFKRGFSPERGEFYIGRRTHLDRVYQQLIADADSFGIETDSGYFPAYRVEQSN